MNGLVRGEQILLLELEVGVGDHEIRARHVTPAEQLGEQQDRDRHAPDVRPAGDDEEIEIAGAFQVHVRDAARQRHHPRVGNRAEDGQQTPVALEERAAQRLAPPALGDQAGASGGKEEPVPVLDDVAAGSRSSDRSRESPRRSASIRSATVRADRG